MNISYGLKTPLVKEPNETKITLAYNNLSLFDMAEFMFAFIRTSSFLIAVRLGEFKFGGGI